MAKARRGGGDTAFGAVRFPEGLWRTHVRAASPLLATPGFHARQGVRAPRLLGLSVATNGWPDGVAFTGTVPVIGEFARLIANAPLLFR